jgi:glycosyltransferase involved in cell wall biosynthesis
MLDGMDKIVRVITRLNIGGPAQHAVLLTAHLAARGIPSLLVTGRQGSWEGEMMDLAVRHGVDLITIPTLSNRITFAADAQAFLRLYCLFRRERPAIVHLHLLKARALGALAARLAGVPIVIETFHGTLFAGYYHPLVVRGLIVGERWLARLMDAVIAVSERVADEIVRLRIAPVHKVRTIPLGLDLDRFIAPFGPPVLRQELRVATSTKLVGYVGRLVPIKGLPYLIWAAAEVTRVVPDVRFLLIGDGSERVRLERMVREAGLAQMVYFLGWRNDLELIYPDLNVVVLPSLNEGTPMSAIEAMAAGCPVVATQVGGVPDLIRDGESGLLVPPRDAGALAAAMIRVLNHRDLGLSLGAAARRAVYPRFSIDRLASDIEQSYREFLTQKRLSMERST